MSMDVFVCYHSSTNITRFNVEVSHLFHFNVEVSHLGGGFNT